jgi:hypothetical protein
MKISTKKLLKRLSKRTEFPLVETYQNDNSPKEECNVCGELYYSNDVMIPEQFGAPICMNCALDIVDAVMTAHEEGLAKEVKEAFYKFQDDESCIG